MSYDFSPMMSPQFDLWIGRLDVAYCYYQSSCIKTLILRYLTATANALRARTTPTNQPTNVVEAISQEKKPIMMQSAPHALIFESEGMQHWKIGYSPKKAAKYLVRNKDHRVVIGRLFSTNRRIGDDDADDVFTLYLRKRRISSSFSRNHSTSKDGHTQQ